ncbi:hypothetical protein F5B17DRAFT_111603 [Nemania serpens]|nr:hypothetical protein F5B17DRAFT_111603 [Nemania serpens]
MAQRGGTYSVALEKASSAKRLNAHPAIHNNGVEKDTKAHDIEKRCYQRDASSQTRNPNDARDDDDREWEIVLRPEDEDGKNTHKCSFNCQISIGWGRWKHTLFSLESNWD